MIEVPEEAFAPRTEDERYGVYVAVGDEPPVLLATASRSCLGEAILTQDEDALAAGLEGLRDLGMFGILDRVERRWVVVPWHRNERRKGASDGHGNDR